MIKFNKSLENDKLTEYVVKLINYNFPDDNIIFEKDLRGYIDISLKKIFNCFENINIPYYNNGKFINFNHLNGDQFCVFLSYLSNTIFKSGNNINLASKVYLLNKKMFGLDLFYEIQLPDIFLLVHPLGTILGRAKYSNYLVVYQNVTVGSLIDGIFPEFSGKNILYSKSSIIGKCIMGKNTILSANSFALNIDIPDGKSLIGQFPNHKFIDSKNLINHYFKIN